MKRIQAVIRGRRGNKFPMHIDCVLKRALLFGAIYRMPFFYNKDYL